MEPEITWGVDGYGAKHYLCDYCELVFGPVDPDEIEHKCDITKPKGHNRDKFRSETDSSMASEGERQ